LMASWVKASATTPYSSNLPMESQVELSVHTTTPRGPLLRLQGYGFGGQVVELAQSGLVFFEQQLSEGPLLIDRLSPLNPNMPVTLRLRTPNRPEERGELRLQPPEKLALLTRRFVLITPERVPASPPPPAKATAADEDDFEFDTDFLRGKAFRNLDAKSVNQLGRVRAGPIDVDILSNARLVTKAQVLFTNPPQGKAARPCFTPDIFQQLDTKREHISPAGLQLLQAQPAKTADSPATNPASPKPGCLYIEDWLPGATANYDPNELQVSLVIPQAFLNRRSYGSVPPGMLTRGENAGFANYNLNHYQSNLTQSQFLGLSSGVNLQGWQVRHTSYLSQNSLGGNTTQQYVAGETYVNRPLIDWQANLAMGEISSFSPLVGGLPLRGLRLSSEEGLMAEEDRSFRPTVRGVARTNARLRVLQNNVVFFEQTVPPGPFEFTDLRPPAPLGDLQVLVTEADGSTQNFLVPYNQGSGKLKPGSYRYSLSAGQLRNNAGVTDTPVLQAFVRYGLGNWPTPGLEWVNTPTYNNLGLQAAFFERWGSVNLNRLQSQWQTTNVGTAQGQAYSLNYGAPALGPVQVFASMLEQSLGYVAPITALSGSGADPYNPLNPKSTLGLSIVLSMGQRGVLNLGVTEQNTWTDNTQTHQYRLSYSVNLQRLSLSFNVDKLTYIDGRAPVDSFGVSAAVPLGVGAFNNNVRLSHNQTGTNQPSQILSVSGYGAESGVNYSLSQSQSGDISSTSASVGTQHRYGSLSASVSQSNPGGSEQTSLSASGGLVVHSGGIILAPNLGTTFAIVEVPNGQGAGVLGSAARVNSSGYGVVPNLSAYYMNDVQISLEGAPNELEVDNPNQKVAPVEGSIVRLTYKATTGRPIFITLQTSTGVRLPIGSTVTDSQGNEVGTVGQGSRAMVRMQTMKDQLKVVWGDKPGETCLVNFALDATTKANANGFTQLKLRCEVVGAEEVAAQGAK
jgi:outer membrane usher protein